MLDWRQIKVALDQTHHIHCGKAIYQKRYDMVMSYHDPGLAAVKLDGSAWHITPTGEPAYPHKFKDAFGFYCGLAAVEDESGFFHINHSGEPLYKERYAWCGNYQEEMCVVRDSTSGYYHLDQKGKAANEKRWHYAGDFRYGIAVVQADDGRSTHIDKSGSFIHGKWFIDLDVFHKGFARARDENGWMHINLQGRPIYSDRFAMIEPFYNGQARVENFEDGRIIINEEGKTILQI